MEAYELLEQELAGWSGMPHVVCCSSGTAALHLALESLQLPPKSRVIVPDFTMIACPRAVTLAGLEPVFVDCDEKTLNTDPDWAWQVTEGEEDSARAMMVVHVYGRKAEWDIEWKMEGEYVVEDLAEAHGVKPHPATDAACWSFYKNKIIAGEEGGAVGFRDPKLAARARQLRSLGFTEEHDFTHVSRGCNYRLSNANASLILKSLRHYLYIGDCPGYGLGLGDRREVEKWYDEQCPDEWRMPPRDAPWIYDLVIPGMSSLSQGELVRKLNSASIAARHFFKPCSSQEEYRYCPVYGNGNAARFSREGIYLPLTPGVVTKEMCQRAFEIIKNHRGVSTLGH